MAVDARPRLHLWPDRDGVSWSVGPCGNRVYAPTYGEALNDALATIGHGSGGAVVIIEPMETAHV